MTVEQEREEASRLAVDILTLCRTRSEEKGLVEHPGVILAALSYAISEVIAFLTDDGEDIEAAVQILREGIYRAKDEQRRRIRR